MNSITNKVIALLAILVCLFVLPIWCADCTRMLSLSSGLAQFCEHMAHGCLKSARKKRYVFCDGVVAYVFCEGIADGFVH